MKKRTISLCMMLLTGIISIPFMEYEYNSRDIDVVMKKIYDYDESLRFKLINDLDLNSAEIVDFHGDSADIKIKKDGNSKIINIPSVDKKAPVFVDYVEEIELEKGNCGEEDILDRFKASDMSGLLEYYIVGDINFNAIGDYSIKVACCDASSNTSIREVLVKIR